MSALLAIFLLSAAGAVSDTDVWNEGVDFYNAGDLTNAVRVLRPLMFSRDYSARAAEVLAKLEYERGNLEEAAAAAQIALRANPKGERENRNFTRAVVDLKAYRDNRHIEAVLESAQGKDPGAMLQMATAECRKLFEEAGSYRTNEAVLAVALADELSDRADALADVWIPVREAIAASVTNEQDSATILLQLDDARQTTLAAAKELSDLDGEAYPSLAKVEADFTRFLKLVVLPPGAMAEDLVAQSNAWIGAERVNGRDWQQDALDFTRSFRAKFPAWARAYEQQAQSDTNLVAFSSEDQAKISALATELEKLQLECIENVSPDKQGKALETIREILELLPKNGNGGGGSPAAGATPPKDSGTNDSGDKNDGNGNGDDEQQAQNVEVGEKGEEENAPDNDDAMEAVLKKAEERNEEHEAEKRARMRKAPLPPNERDW